MEWTASRKISLYWRLISGVTARHPLTVLLASCFLLFFLTCILLWFFDGNINSLKEAFFFTLPSFLGQIAEGYKFGTGQFIASVVGLITSIGILAIITSVIVSKFILFCLRGGRMVERVRFSNHIIICGWNTQGERIVRELKKAGVTKSRGVVILADLEKRPIQEPEVDFVQGDPTQYQDLERAGLRNAQSVIVLADFTSNPNEADAKALLIILAVETLNPDVYTCVQILNSANKIHFERVRADEIICLDRIGGNLMVASAISPGISYIVSELLMFNSGSEIYRWERPFPEGIIGKRFRELQSALAKYGTVLIAVETDFSEKVLKEFENDIVYKIANGRIIVVNPLSEYKIRKGDALFVIAEKDPASAIRDQTCAPRPGPF